MILELKDEWLIGMGTVKLVYQHPHDEGKLIKVIRPEIVHADGGFLNHSFFKRRINQGVYRQFRREIVQYLELCKRYYSSNEFCFPMETPYGLINTNKGLGLVVEKIIAPNGRGMNLKQMKLAGLMQKNQYQALEVFFKKCADIHLVFGEVNYEGILYTEYRGGGPEFVLVDGIGEKLAIPMRHYLKSVNSMYIEKVRERIFMKIAQVKNV